MCRWTIETVYFDLIHLRLRIVGTEEIRACQNCWKFISFWFRSSGDCRANNINFTEHSLDRVGFYCTHTHTHTDREYLHITINRWIGIIWKSFVRLRYSQNCRTVYFTLTEPQFDKLYVTNNIYTADVDAMGIERPIKCVSPFCFRKETTTTTSKRLPLSRILYVCDLFVFRILLDCRTVEATIVTLRCVTLRRRASNEHIGIGALN